MLPGPAEGTPHKEGLLRVSGTDTAFLCSLGAQSHPGPHSLPLEKISSRGMKTWTLSTSKLGLFFFRPGPSSALLCLFPHSLLLSSFLQLIHFLCPAPSLNPHSLFSFFLQSSAPFPPLFLFEDTHTHTQFFRQFQPLLYF